MPDHWALNALKWIVAGCAAFWLSLPAAVQLLVVLSGFDLLSCLFTHRASLHATLKRIVVTLILTGAVEVVYVMAKDLSGFNLGFDIGTAVALFYVFGEMIELTLNCSTLVRIPPPLVAFLEKAQGMTGQQRKDLAELESHDHPRMREL